MKEVARILLVLLALYLIWLAVANKDNPLSVGPPGPPGSVIETGHYPNR